MYKIKIYEPEYGDLKEVLDADTEAEAYSMLFGNMDMSKTEGTSVEVRVDDSGGLSFCSIEDILTEITLGAVEVSSEYKEVEIDTDFIFLAAETSSVRIANGIRELITKKLIQKKAKWVQNRQQGNANEATTV